MDNSRAQQDERLEENVYNGLGTSFLLDVNCEVNPCKYEHIDTVGKARNPITSFLAHEVAEVMKRAVTSNHDELMPNIYDARSVNASDMQTSDAYDFVMNISIDFHQMYPLCGVETISTFL